MSGYQVKRANGHPMEWTAHGRNADEALASWKDCFGEGFELAQAKGRAVR